MAEVLDYYSFAGLPRTATWEEVKKKVHKHYLEFQRKANAKGPGSKEAEQRDFWAKALAFFKDEVSKKAYDAQLDAWLRSPAAQEAKARAQSAAEDFAQKTSGADELLKQAWSELECGNVPEAMLLAGKALVLDHGSWEAYFALGVANFRWNELDEAMSCLRSAARLNPKSADVFAGMGEIFERQERWKEAYEQYRRASVIEPDVLAHRISMGLICVRAGVPDEGIEILRACQSEDPDDPGLSWVLGVALAESARLGWTYVPNGHPRVPEGWWAMSREEALQAIEKLNEASALKIEDLEIAQNLAEIRKDVEDNVKRKFVGNWILLGIFAIATLGVFLRDGVSGGIAVLLFAAAYYGVNLVPQYTINARILKGDSIAKRGFLFLLEHIEHSVWWLQLVVFAFLFMFLPAFMVYWGIRNWTGANAPLGKAVGDIRAKHSSGASSNSAAAESTAEVGAHQTGPESPPSATAQSDAGTAVDNSTPAPTMSTILSAMVTTAKELPSKVSGAAAVGETSTGDLATTKAINAFTLTSKMMTVLTVAVIMLVVAVGTLYFNKSKNEERLRAELEQKAAQVQEAERRASAAAEESRRQAIAMQEERDRGARAAAKELYVQKMYGDGQRKRLPQSFLKDYNERYLAWPDYKAIALALDSDGVAAWGWNHGSNNQSSADDRALSACNKQRYEIHVKSDCRLYAAGGVIVWDARNNKSDTFPSNKVNLAATKSVAGSACINPSECGENLTCIKGVCRAPLSPAGSACINPSECGENLTCIKGVCRAPYTVPGSRPSASQPTNRPKMPAKTAAAPASTEASPSSASQRNQVAKPVAVEPSTQSGEIWLVSLREALGRCSQEPLFNRILCNEKARWKYCAPDRWGNVPEC